MLNKSTIFFISKIILALLSIGLVLGTSVHEVLGHALTEVLFGGKIHRIVILTFNIYPNFYHESISESKYGQFVFGYVESDLENLPDIQQGIVLLMGSVSTLIISVITVFILLDKFSNRLLRYYVLLPLAVYFIDIGYHTMLLGEPVLAAYMIGEVFGVITLVIFAILISLAIIYKMFKIYYPQGLKFFRILHKIRIQK